MWLLTYRLLQAAPLVFGLQRLLSSEELALSEQFAYRLEPTN